MDSTERRKIALELWCRGSQPIKFVKEYVGANADTIDEPFLRSAYILLSFGFEMILKSRLVMISAAQNRDDLLEGIKKFGHEIIKMDRALNQEREKMGISTVESKTESCRNPINRNDQYKYYAIKTLDDREIRIEDFNNIRYGCIGGMRYVKEQEHKNLIEYTKLIFGIADKIEKANS